MSSQGGGGWKTILSRMPICGIYIYLYVPYIHNPGVHRRVYGLDLIEGNGCLVKEAMEVARLDEENDCRF